MKKTIAELIDELQEALTVSARLEHDSFSSAVRHLHAYRNGHAIQVTWGVTDVQAARPELNDEQAAEVLQEARDSHDCNYGITWDTFKNINV
jgi:hypothetical protein